MREKPVGRRVSTQRVDDIDGSAASQTVAFSIDHQRLEIDLSDDNATALRAVFAPYVAAGREADAARNGTRHNRAQNDGSPRSDPQKRASTTSTSAKGADQTSGSVDSVAEKSARPTSGAGMSGLEKTAVSRKKPATERSAGATAAPYRATGSSGTARSGGKSSTRTPAFAPTAAPAPEEKADLPARPSTTPEKKPKASLAVVLPLQHRARAATEVDVAAQRRRLTASIGELLRVLAVVTVTRATNRVVAVVAKPKHLRHAQTHVPPDDSDAKPPSDKDGLDPTSVVPAG